MDVDKRLAGIQAVQTLLRLNRTMRGKDGTFVLDFVNEPKDIYEAFKPYYETTPMGDETDPQHLNTLAHQLAEWKIFTEDEINVWCEIWFRNRMNPTGGEHKKLNGILDLAVERYKKLSEEEQNEFKGHSPVSAICICSCPKSFLIKIPNWKNFTPMGDSCWLSYRQHRTAAKSKWMMMSN